jgi:LPS-assembly lipoprotein
MKRFVTALVLASLAVPLGACGFQPVYAPVGGKLAEAGLIKIEPIEGRAGHMLRQALMQELALGVPGLTEPVTLTIRLDNQLSRLAFQPDGAASRSSVLARGSYRLAGETVSLDGSSDVETGFLVPDSPFGDIAAQTSASDRAMRLLAKRIADDIRLQFAAR